MDMIIRTAPHGGKYRKHLPAKKKNIYSYKQIEEFQQMPLHDKVCWSGEVIRTALEKISNPGVAFSAGKDSTVLLHILLQSRPDIPVIYGNTGIEFPECIRFAKKLKKEWNLNFYEAKPEISFWKIVEEYGWPLLGKGFGVSGVAHKTSREKFFAELEADGKLSAKYRIQKDNPISSACCTFLKERPSEKLQKKLGINGVFLGIMAAESRRRMFLTMEHGELYQVKSNGMWKCNPLAIWKDEDIWEYIRKFSVPYAALYDMGYTNECGRFVNHRRNGCMFCGMDIRFPDNHLSIMRRTHPKAWKMVMLRKGLGKVILNIQSSICKQYDMFSETIPVEEHIEKWPCTFDRI